MSLSPFHALYKAHKLSNYAFGQDRLTAVFASSNIEVYPYQIAAARFALRSPYLKGVILCDEGSLGKTYEALLINRASYVLPNEPSSHKITPFRYGERKAKRAAAIW